MSIRHGIVTGSSGGTSVEREPCRGSTFRVSLPVSPRAGAGASDDPIAPGGLSACDGSHAARRAP
ncbi:hypothetical protein LXT21_35300 [Myxococcus sp. K38C18041901]|nr:hypothetical protein [Myxococcus guangdongensis]